MRAFWSGRDYGLDSNTVAVLLECRSSATRGAEFGFTASRKLGRDTSPKYVPLLAGKLRGSDVDVRPRKGSGFLQQSRVRTRGIERIELSQLEYTVVGWHTDMQSCGIEQYISSGFGLPCMTPTLLESRNIALLIKSLLGGLSHGLDVPRSTFWLRVTSGLGMCWCARGVGERRMAWDFETDQETRANR